MTQIDTNYNKTMWINNETVVDAQKLNKIENQMHLITQSSVTNSERLTVVEDLVDTKIDDVTTKESDDGTIVDFYANGIKKESITVQGGNGIKVSDEAPTNKKHVWLDTSDEEANKAIISSGLAQDIQDNLALVKAQILRLDEILNDKMDAGYFLDIEPGTDPSNKPQEPELENPFEAKTEAIKDDEDKIPKPADFEENFAGNVKRICIKRGFENAMLQDTFHPGELVYCINSNILYIADENCNLKSIGSGGGSSSESSGTLTGKYIELTSTNKKKYKLTINDDGYAYIYDSAADTASDAVLTDASKFNGLVINHVYGGGTRDNNRPYVSHNFIELYNNSVNTLNLKGLSLQYWNAGDKNWKVLELVGVVKPYHSFLVRGARVNNPYDSKVRLSIEKYDMAWNSMELSDKGYKVYLTVGRDAKDDFPNPFDINGANAKAPGYIGLLGARSFLDDEGIGVDSTIDAAEGSPVKVNIHHSARRIDFRNNQRNYYDFESLNLRNCDMDLYRPRYSGDGKWDVYFDKLKLSNKTPMVVNMGFGKDGNTSRTFTWQTSSNVIINYLKYKKSTDTKWTVIKSNQKKIAHPDTTAIVHSAIIEGLTPGTYSYCVGDEGHWTDVYDFVVKAPTNSDKITFIQIGDQQGIDREEYEVWATVNDFMEKTVPEHDFVINVGDISQNGGAKSFEWRYYYEFTKHNIYRRPHMTVCGNNDLTAVLVGEKYQKRDSTAFTYYSTVQYDDDEKQHRSCYSWNYGYIHFIGLNSNVFESNSEITQDQIKWLAEDVKKAKNQKKWTVVYIHESPYTHTKSEILKDFINPLVDAGADVVLCGHHHRYTRTKKMGKLNSDGTDNPDASKGFYTIMGQAAGIKLKGKTAEHPDNAKWVVKDAVNTKPMFIKWEATYDQLKMTAYQLANLCPIEDYKGYTPILEVFDTLTITK